MLVQQNLLCFDLRGVQNGVALCPICHVMFDRSVDPAFVFFPNDLQFFIDWELRDRSKRRECDGSMPRSVPTARDYLSHQVQCNLISAESPGGLYKRVFLQNYLHSGRGFQANVEFADPIPWHGAPFAALKRAFAILGSPRIDIVPVAVEEQLVLLKNLYYRPNFHPDLPSLRGSVMISAADESKPLGEPAEPTKKVDSTCDQISTCDHISDHISGHAASTGQQYVQSEWILGPETTALDVMQRYGPMMEASAAFGLSTSPQVATGGL